ncbi:MAG TPA: hypothetical protein VFU34_08675 [Gaiellaceae bacterium]|nr:hypothetical protein [Gaiellaceae bacterium]HEU5264701.1 hypothetical protein [Gaiellaceae bacterium]
MDDVLGLLLLAVYIVGILAVSSAITFAVVKIFPTERNPKKPDKPDTPASGDGVEGAGRLFRKAKRGTA